MPKNPLIGSERKPLPGAHSIGKADPAERLEVTLVLRHRQHDQLQERVRKIAAGDKSERHLTHDEYAQQFGADPTDIQAVKQFAN
jgi:kumamolisin